MSCNIMVTSPDDCPPTCTASSLPSPETRFFCQANSALAGDPGHGGQGAFAGKGSAIATPTSDATLSAAEVPAPTPATAGGQQDGGLVITQTSVQVVTVGSPTTMSGGSVTPVSSPSSSFPSLRPAETAKPTFPITHSTSSTMPASSTTIASTMSDPTATASALNTATTGRKPFIQTTAGWVTVFLVVVFILVGAILGAWLWRRRKKMKASKQEGVDSSMVDDEAAMSRDAGDWSAVPLTTIAGPEYRSSTMPAAAMSGGPQLTTAGRDVKQSEKSVPARSSGEWQRDVASTQAGPTRTLSDPSPSDASPRSKGTVAGLRIGRRAPSGFRFSMTSSTYSGDSDPDKIEPIHQTPATESTHDPTKAHESSSNPHDSQREQEWNADAISGILDAESAADRAANDAREKRLKAHADSTQATTEVKDSWDPTKNISAGPPLPKKLPFTGVGPKARPKPEDAATARDSIQTTKFLAKEQRDLEAEIHGIMDMSQATRMVGQDYDRDAPRGSPVRPKKSVTRGGGLVDVTAIPEEEIEQRGKLIAAEKEARRLATETGGKFKRVDGKVVGRTASPIVDNEQIQEARVEWGVGGMVRVGTGTQERVEGRAVGRTAPLVVSNEDIGEGGPRKKGGKF